MVERFQAIVNWLLGPEPITDKRPGHLWARWIFLRALGLIYFSAFYSLLFQIKGLIGPQGILPAQDYLQAVGASLHAQRFWFAPTLLWFGASDRALMLITWAGIIASVLVIVNLWPRASLLICFLCFLSFVAAAQDFSGYQSDGMLLEAGFIALFFAPPGFLPGLGSSNPPSRASLFLLQWEWFRIYFESGVAKLASGDPAWRHFTAMDDYYQNGPLPTWIGWYVQQLPHWFHASATFYTLLTELVIVWMLFLPRRFRIACFCIVTPVEISIILTANYTFLNYLVLLLGVLLLDDRLLEWILPKRIRELLGGRSAEVSEAATVGLTTAASAKPAKTESSRAMWRRALTPLRRAFAGLCLGLVFYVTTLELLWMFVPGLPLPETPVRALDPLRIANRYGLFAVMTHGRYEIEFQGSSDGKTWIAYPFRYKPQEIDKAPGIYAPYQPRFEWNLWFASLGSWRESRFVVWTEERLLKNDPDVLALFASDPFPNAPPRFVRTIIYQYWFTDLRTKRMNGNWWRRETLGEYAPALEREPDGKIAVLDWPTHDEEQQ
ncbi:MAG: lipase maturation factor family protein [Candidatus Acidiferrales bacterium]